MCSSSRKHEFVSSNVSHRLINFLIILLEDLPPVFLAKWVTTTKLLTFVHVWGDWIFLGHPLCNQKWRADDFRVSFEYNLLSPPVFLLAFLTKRSSIAREAFHSMFHRSRSTFHRVSGFENRALETLCGVSKERVVLLSKTLSSRRVRSRMIARRFNPVRKHHRENSASRAFTEINISAPLSIFRTLQPPSSHRYATGSSGNTF